MKTWWFINSLFFLKIVCVFCIQNDGHGLEQNDVSVTTSTRQPAVGIPQTNQPPDRQQTKPGTDEVNKPVVIDPFVSTRNVSIEQIHSLEKTGVQSNVSNVSISSNKDSRQKENFNSSQINFPEKLTNALLGQQEQQAIQKLNITAQEQRTQAPLFTKDGNEQSGSQEVKNSSAIQTNVKLTGNNTDHRNNSHITDGMKTKEVGDQTSRNSTESLKSSSMNGITEKIPSKTTMIGPSPSPPSPSVTQSSTFNSSSPVFTKMFRMTTSRTPTDSGTRQPDLPVLTSRPFVRTSQLPTEGSTKQPDLPVQTRRPLPDSSTQGPDGIEDNDYLLQWDDVDKEGGDDPWEQDGEGDWDKPWNGDVQLDVDKNDGDDEENGEEDVVNDDEDFNEETLNSVADKTGDFWDEPVYNKNPFIKDKFVVNKYQPNNSANNSMMGFYSWVLCVTILLMIIFVLFTQQRPRCGLTRRRQSVQGSAEEGKRLINNIYT